MTKFKNRKFSIGGQKFLSPKTELYVLQELPEVPYSATAVVLVALDGRAWVGVSFYSPKDFQSYYSTDNYFAIVPQFPYDAERGFTIARGRAGHAMFKRDHNPDGIVDITSQDTRSTDALWLAKHVIEARKKQVGPVPQRTHEDGTPIRATDPRASMVLLPTEVINQLQLTDSGYLYDNNPLAQAAQIPQRVTIQTQLDGRITDSRAWDVLHKLIGNFDQNSLPVLSVQLFEYLKGARN